MRGLCLSPTILVLFWFCYHRKCTRYKILCKITHVSYLFILAIVWIPIQVLDYEEATNLLHVINIKRFCFSFWPFYEYLPSHATWFLNIRCTYIYLTPVFTVQNNSLAVFRDFLSWKKSSSFFAPADYIQVHVWRQARFFMEATNMNPHQTVSYTFAIYAS